MNGYNYMYKNLIITCYMDKKESLLLPYQIFHQGLFSFCGVAH
jgi:hypothetical protein